MSDDDAFARRAARAADPDADLTCRVIQRLLGEPRLAGQPVTVQAQNGVVTVFGTVDGLYARVLAADLIRETPGVTDICNRLELARAADVTATLERPDPFDELVARWNHIEPVTPPRPRVTRLLRGALAWLLGAGRA